MEVEIKENDKDTNPLISQLLSHIYLTIYLRLLNKQTLYRYIQICILFYFENSFNDFAETNYIKILIEWLLWGGSNLYGVKNKI